MTVLLGLLVGAVGACSQGDDEPAGLDAADREAVCPLVDTMAEAKAGSPPFVAWDEPGGSVEGTHDTLEAAITVIGAQAEVLTTIADHLEDDVREGALGLAESSRDWVEAAREDLDEARAEARPYTGSVAYVSISDLEQARALYETIEAECGVGSSDWLKESA